MNLLGITAEYNPFHNGHKYHIDKAISDLNPDAVVVVMSGNFTQRGNIACFDKWTRAKCALLNGADLVIELPVSFATSSAERFAFGSIYLLDHMKVKHVSFGSEDNLDELQALALKLSDSNLKIEKNSPVPFHIARQAHLDANEIITKPNNILAVEYLKAINKLKSDIIPHQVKRIGAGYHDLEIIDGFASATKVRELLKNNENFEHAVPNNIVEILKASNFTSEHELFNQLIYSIITKTPSELNKYAHIREGIENRIFKCAFAAENFDELVQNIKSKRYTYTSISRMLISILLGIKKDSLCETPEYIRVLGLNDKGAKALKYIEENTDLPIITKVSNSYRSLSGTALKSFETDLRASDIYYSLCGNLKNGRPDYINSPIKI